MRAVVCTTGLAAVHGMEPEYGIDIDDLGWLREALALNTEHDASDEDDLEPLD